MNKRSAYMAVTAAVAVLLVGCQAATSDKSGADTAVLRLATTDGEVDFGLKPSAPQAFVDELEEVSAGRLKVEVTTAYGDRRADAESKLVEAIASGALDGGWPSTRAFAAAGIGGLEPIEAPMVITSYEAEKALVSGPIAEQVLDELDGSGVVGLSLAVSALRRPFAADAPLLAPDDWEGIRFRSYNSQVQADAVRALGGEPANLGIDWIDALHAGTLHGTEFDIAGYHAAGFTTEAGHVTRNVVLWPKVFVFSISQKRFDSLTEQQREWVREAAARATQVSVDATYDETTPARELCDMGVRFFDANEDQIEEMLAAFKPVIDGLAADAESAPLLAAIKELAEQHPQADAPDVPAECLRADNITAENSVPDERSALPDGTYRVEITLDDVEAAGLSNGPGWTGTWTLLIEDGTYQLTCRPIDQPERDCGNSGGYEGALEAGYLRGTGDVVYFVFDTELLSQLTGCQLPADNTPGHCYTLPDFKLTWTLDGNELAFTSIDGAEAWERLLKPYQKID